jgi:hypothetical protein
MVNGQADTSRLADALGTAPDALTRLTRATPEGRGAAARKELPALFRGGAEAQAEAKIGAFERDQGVLKKTAEAERDVVRGTRMATQQLESGLQQRGVFEAPQYKASDYAANSASRLLTAVLLGGIARTSAAGQLQAIKAMQDAEEQGLMDQFEQARMRFDEQEKQRQDSNKMLKDRFDRMIDLLSKDRNAALVEAKLIEGNLGKGIIAAELRAGNYSKAYDLFNKAIEQDERVRLERVKASLKPSAQAAVSGGMGTPAFTEPLRIHESGVPLAPINIYEGLDPKEVATTRRQEFELAKSVRQKLQEETTKARQTKSDMDVAEAALKNIEKKGGQPTGGIYGLPVVGQAMQAVRTSQDPDAARFRTVAAQMQRNAYVPGEGQISNFERELFAQANLDLGRPMKTNFDLIDANRIASERTIERAQFFERYFAVNRTMSGADELWQTYLENNPILIRDQAGEIVKNPNRAKSYVEWFRSRQGQPASQAPARATTPASRAPGSDMSAFDAPAGESMELTADEVVEQAEMNGITPREAARRLMEKGYTIKE